MEERNELAFCDMNALNDELRDYFYCSKPAFVAMKYFRDEERNGHENINNQAS